MTAFAIRTLKSAQPDGAPRVPGIYKITCVPTGRFYIGSAADIRLRWLSHMSTLALRTHHSSRLQKAWEQHGAERFVFEIVEFVAIEDLAEREQFYIDFTGCCNRLVGYNVSNVAAAKGACKPLKISQSNRLEVVAAYRAGETARSIAARHHVSKTAILNVLRKFKVERRTSSETNTKHHFDREDAIRRYLAGEPGPDLAKSIGVPACIVNTVIFTSVTAEQLAARASLVAAGGHIARRGERNGARTKPGCVLRGEGHGGSKLTNDAVKQIRHLSATEQTSYLTLAKMFSTTKTTISRIVLGKAWKHVGCIANPGPKPPRKPESIMRGEGHANSKLTNDIVKQIRQIRETQGTSFPALGKLFGVTAACIANVVWRNTWMHVA